MAVYSVGDKVSVLWEDTLFDAAVIKVHSNGTVNVTFKKDGSIGKNLTKAENILQLLAEDGKKKEKPRHRAHGECKVEDCASNTVTNGSYCGLHGGVRGFCEHPGCETPCVPGSCVCAKHGAHGICTAYGCVTNALKGKEVCYKHSTDKVPCSAEGCGSIATARGLCRTHDGKPVCSTAGCDTAVKARGLCLKHGAFGFCSFGNCITASVSIKKGNCRRHSGHSDEKVCTTKGCTALARARGVCGKHGSTGQCQSDGCTANAYSRGSPHCMKHGGGKKKPCSVAGCTTNSQARGLCAKHGGRPDECWIKGCTNQMRSRLKTCATHGGYGYCALPDCWTPAIRKGGNCFKHTSK